MLGSKSGVKIGFFDRVACEQQPEGNKTETAF